MKFKDLTNEVFGEWSYDNSQKLYEERNNKFNKIKGE